MGRCMTGHGIRNPSCNTWRVVSIPGKKFLYLEDLEDLFDLLDLELDLDTTSETLSFSSESEFDVRKSSKIFIDNMSNEQLFTKIENDKIC